MQGLTRLMLAGMALGLALLPAGCLKREERITISPDGSVVCRIEYEGNPGDFEGPDALPGPASGWDVKREVKEKEDGKDVVLSATRVFAPGATLPSTYAGPEDPDKALYLDFPTTLTVEQRHDGTYCHFRRVYTPRRWAYIHFWERTLLEDDPITDLAEKDIDELTHKDRVTMLTAFGRYQFCMHHELVDEALRACRPPVPQDQRLAVRQTVFDVADGVDYDRLARQSVEKSDKQRDDWLAKESEAVMSQLDTAMQSCLTDRLKWNTEQIRAFRQAYDRAEKYHNITNSHNGHMFDIYVKMPGTLVGHNGNEIDEGGYVRWEFDGSVFRDRTWELLATSMVPRTDGKK